MSSLMQFTGKSDRKRGVQLQCYKVIEEEWQANSDNSDFLKPAEEEPCLTCGIPHPKLYGFWRKPAGMFGPWVVFRYKGKENVPDLSTAIGMKVLPKDAKPIGQEYWHKE
jgi:hypothetical protein